ncbi:unnamed protein product [Allacma fusca]|uniref:Uncharacterized protein n=1 Tax=Allacma fusca TaxID=39272 RepID=A0A8J2JU48_9HEXA|nr:unnamed protein product [Allacma fusca]
MADLHLQLKSELHEKSSSQFSEVTEKVENAAYFASLRRFFNLGHKMRYSPYKFDEGTKTLQFVEIRFQKLAFRLNIFMLIGYEAFLIFRFGQVVRNKSSKVQDTLTGLFYPVAYILLNVNYWITWKNWGTLHLFFNQSSTITRNIREAISSGPNFFANTALFAIVLASLLRGLNVFTNPGRPEWISSILLDLRAQNKIPMWLRIIFALYHANLVGITAYTCLFHSIYFMIHGVNTAAAAKVLGRVSQERAPTLEEVTDLLIRSRCFNSLRVLESSYDSIYCKWLFITEMCGIFIVTARLFLAVVNQSIGNFLSATAVLTLLLILGRWQKLKKTLNKRCHPGRSYPIHGFGGSGNHFSQSQSA